MPKQLKEQEKNYKLTTEWPTVYKIETINSW